MYTWEPLPVNAFETNRTWSLDVNNLNEALKKTKVKKKKGVLALFVLLVDEAYQLPAEMLCLPCLEECFHTGLTCYTSIATI